MVHIIISLTTQLLLCNTVTSYTNKTLSKKLSKKGGKAVGTPVRGIGIVTLEVALDTPTHRAELHIHASTPSILLL